jgi:hypothetical protein
VTEVWSVSQLRQSEAENLLDRYAAGQRQFLGEFLSACSLRSAKLAGARLDRAVLNKADLSEANLNDASLTSADLTGARLRGACLWQADLGGARLAGADLSQADMTGAFLGDADLTGANLTNADLSHVDLGRTNLSGCDLTNATMTGALCSKTVFAYTALNGTKGLEEIKHLGPSSLAVDTIVGSRGKLPLTFLRGCGLPEAFIASIHSAQFGNVDFHSCFISYSSANQSFVDRLHADLQTHGVRCWYAPMDLKIGDKFRDKIEHSIKTHDKLLIVLSPDALASEWVEAEVEAALDEEKRAKRAILFPIRVDQSVLGTDNSWAAHVRRTRHIGDFSGWQDAATYRQSFDRLLRDLSRND